MTDTPTNPPPLELALHAVVFGSVAWFIADLLAVVDVVRDIPEAPASGVIRLWQAACAAAALAAAGGCLAQALSARLPMRARLLPWVLPLATGVVVVGVDLFGGDRIVQWRWTPVVRPLVIALGVAATWAASAVLVGLFARAARGDRAPLLAGAALLLSLPALAWIDRSVLHRLYPAFHAALAVLFLLAASLAGALLAFGAPLRRRRARTSLGALCCFFGVHALVTSTLTEERRLGVRELIRMRAPLTSKLLAALPSGEVERDEVSQDVLAALRRRVACDPAALDAAFPGRRDWNLVIITIDTLRADRVGVERGGRRLTPALDALASSETVTFSTCYAQYPSTLLSLPSFFAGIYPVNTGLERGEESDVALDLGPNLVRSLRAAGRRAFAETAFPDDLTRRVAPVAREFEHIDATGRTLKLARPVVDSMLAAMRETSPTQPWMAWLHIFDPHAPYRHHEGFTLGESRVELYDGSVAYADHHVGRFLDALRARPDWERTVVVVHSDHGQEFREHGGLHHGSSVYDEQVRVPLLIRVPGLAARTVDRVVELVDVAPTLWELFDLAVPPRCQGHSLLPLLAPGLGEMTATPAAFMQLRRPGFGTGRLDGVRLGRWKLVHDLDADTWELYDLEADPTEQRNVAARHVPRYEEMRALLAAFTAWCDAPPAPAPKGTPDTPEVRRRREAVRALASGEGSVPGVRMLYEGWQMSAAEAVEALPLVADPADPSWLLGAYARFMLRPPEDHAEAKALTESVLAAGPDVCLPVLRRMLTTSDLALRRRAEEVLRARGRGEWIPRMRELDDDATVLRDAAFGARAWAEAARRCAELVERAGYTEWGLVLEQVFYLERAGRHDEAGRVAAAAAAAARGRARAILERLAATVHARPPEGLRLVVLESDPAVREGYWTARVTLDGGELVHGLRGGAIGGATLGCRVVDAAGATLGESLLPLPQAGLVPGETLDVPVSVAVPEGVAARAMLAVVQEGMPVAGPVLVPVPGS